MVNIKPRYIFKNIPFKGTVFVISSDPLFQRFFKKKPKMKIIDFKREKIESS